MSKIKESILEEKWREKWNSFIKNPPFHSKPFNKRNWGNKLHSLCSFYGKLKPSITHHLINVFTEKGDTVLDCFSGSGTVPFESALLGRRNFGIDINPLSVTLSKAKVGRPDMFKCQEIFKSLKSYIQKKEVCNDDVIRAKSFGFNKKLSDYYHEKTFEEIIKARSFFRDYSAKKDCNYYLILSCLVHILHGNRPYALSRRSHPITPYAPSGEYIYKSLTSKLYEKLSRSLEVYKGEDFFEGCIFHQDILEEWPDSIKDVDAIITSPPFFDSTRYYMVNWIRNWFLGWEEEDFSLKKDDFIDEKQKKSFLIYKEILLQCKKRLSKNGVVVFHLGKSKKKDMGNELAKIAKPIFNNIELHNEDVSHLEKHGVKDKGTVKSHQYLLMFN